VGWPAFIQRAQGDWQVRVALTALPDKSAANLWQLWSTDVVPYKCPGNLSFSLLATFAVYM